MTWAGSSHNPAAIFAEANGHFAAGRIMECITACRRGLEVAPAHPAFAALLFNASMAVGDPEECWRPMMDAAPAVGDHLDYLSHLATAANYSVNATPQEVWKAHAAYGQALERQRPARPGDPPFPNDPAPDRPLRVGIVSYDFRSDGSTGFFLSPLFTHLDPAQFHIFAYQTRALPEDRTEFFRSRAAGWRQLPEGDNGAIARAVRHDQIDIALEINGHSGVRAIPAFQPRCAPVQVSYMGYSNTTGLRTIDWRIVDSITDPPPPHAADGLAAERLFRLDPCFLCYVPTSTMPLLPQAPPSARNGYITYGAFSELAKLTSRTLQLWSRVLAATPGSRLLLKNRAMETAAAADHLRQRLRTAGMDLARVELLPRTPTFVEHLRVYEQMDIALDTTPYNGTTTVCQALIMGVPIIGLQPPPLHDRHAARVTLSLLTAADLPEFIARDDEDFVRIACGLAADPGRLAEYQATLRERVTASALFDAAGFGRRFGAALRHMWKIWCQTADPRH